jgi:AAA family ATP:ADP antiporter
MTRYRATDMRTRSRSILIAMGCAAAITAQFISGKATRDALFLTSLGAAALPMMLIATSIFSILLVGASARWSKRVRPAVFVPASFLASALLYLVEFAFRSKAPSVTAVAVYLHVSGIGPLLASGFWLIASELFDPRSAKQGFGRIGGAATLGGLGGAVVAERVAALFGVPTMLLVLAALQVVTAWAIRRLAAGSDASLTSLLDPSSGARVAPARSGLVTVAEQPHLRNLAGLVLLGTTSAALLEYLFKVKAVETFGPGDHLLRFFAAYYAATSVVTFLLQALSTTAALQRFGLGLTTSTPSIAILAGSLAGLIVPGFGAMVIARAAETVFRSSWFRTGYELFYTPVSAAEKRGTKPLIDVAVDRLGDAVGGGIVRLAVVFLPATPSAAILALAMLISLCAIVMASRLNRWYVRTLEASLVERGGGIDFTYTHDYSMYPVLVAMRDVRAAAQTARDDAQTSITTRPVDPQVDDIVALRSRDRDRVLAVLSRDSNLDAALVPHVIPLLAWDASADYALVALRKVAEERVGELTDALLDPNQDDTVRRRLARVFSVAVSQRAADGLLLALDDARFDVRFQAARSLVSIADSYPRVRLNADRVYEVVLAELAVGRPVWESRRLLDGFVSESPLDEFVRDRAGQSLAHVFTLLSLVLPRQPLQIAFRSLNGGDTPLRGTALEYLENVLPSRVKEGLWPFLVPASPAPGAHQHGRTIATLLQSSSSVTVRSIARDLGKHRIAGFGRA